MIIVISVAMLLSACQTPPNVPSEPDSTSDSATASPAYKHDNERYPLTAGLATEEDVDTIGISAGGVIVDGAKYAKSGRRYCVVEDMEPFYMDLGDVPLPNIPTITDIPDGCPVIMYGDGIKIINNTDMAVYSSYVPFASGGPILECHIAPTRPGMYWLLLTAESNEEPWTAPDYVPTDGEVFVTAYYYLFAVSVE